MKFISSLLIGSLALTTPGLAAEIQSRFVGPAKAKVWRHTQASWNVEDVTGSETLFELTRGLDDGGAPFLKLVYRSAQPGLSATFGSTTIERVGTWDMAPRSPAEVTVSGISKNGLTEFLVPNAAAFVDQESARFVQSIRFEVHQGSNRLFAETLIPMYVRGKGLTYWNNPIDAYGAHAGSGEISVATAAAAERGSWDTWEGRLVRPQLSYIERNTLSADSVIGLHRHEANQEVFLVDSGQATMTMGMIPVASGTYKVQRKWDGSGAVAETDEFYATGGWLETRTLKRGQLAVIVPDGARKDRVYVHGLRAITPVAFWTMGTKN